MSSGAASSPLGPTPFVVYVEGARDGEILRAWARRLAPALGRALPRALTILGGRRPERARAHLDDLRSRHARARGLCILDRDAAVARFEEREGLEIFSWSRRHIESYLLVPDAIRRSQRLDPRQELQLARLLRDHLPQEGEHAEAVQRIDAKRLLGPKGPFARELGRPLAPGRIARAMRAHEIAPEVVGVLERIAGGLGVSPRVPEVTVRGVGRGP